MTTFQLLGTTPAVRRAVPLRPATPFYDTLPPADAVPPLLDALIISDLHLGSDNCQAKLLTALLESILAGAEDAPIAAATAPLRTRRLIINGDVFDSIDFRRLKKTHWKVLSLLRHLSDKIEVIWIAGNHDGSADIVSHLLGVRVESDYTLQSGGRDILIIHGHQWDAFIEDHPVLTWLADSCYALLQKLDRTHHVARLAKRKSKTFIRCAEKIRRGAVALARKRGCSAVICGHTHHAVDPATDISPDPTDVHYYNSGCWTELPCTYLAVQAAGIELRTWSPAHAMV